MSYTIQDIVGLLVAVASFGVVLVLPAVALAEISNAFGFRRLRGAGVYALALLVGYAVLPVADSLLCRWFGLGGALAVNFALAAYGARVLWMKGLPRPDARTVAACAVWFVVLTAVWIDIDRGDRLYASLLIVDTVKHAATVRALVESGTAPPIDPFFLRAEPAAYYYYFYTLSALAERLCKGLIDSRAAVGGQVFWTGLALVGLVALVFRKARFGVGRLSLPLLLFFMAAAGLQIVLAVGIGLLTGDWIAQVNWLIEEVTSWPMLVLWVPHHVAALIASWTGFLLLTNAVTRADVRRPSAAWSDAWAIALAAAAFASAAGLSTWVTLGAAATVALWVAVLAVERRWPAVLMVTGAGLLAFIVALPDLIDLLRFRAFGGPPIALTVRSFVLVDSMVEDGLARQLARLAALPLNYLVGFGVFLIGSFVFWRRRGSRPWSDGEVARLLIISALASLVLGSFFKSTIANNDLGWRVIMFAQLATLLWTVAALGPSAVPHISLRERLRHAPGLIALALVVGIAGVLYDFVGLRNSDPLRRDAQVDREVRSAYAWLAASPIRPLVVQHNPNVERAFGYGLYSRSRAAVSDRHIARLFGAGQAAVAERLDELVPVFATAMPADEAWRRLRHNHVAAVLVTANDVAWRGKDSWVWAAPPLYASEHVRVLPVKGEERADGPQNSH